jgi:hypothetical protein
MTMRHPLLLLSLAILALSACGGGSGPGTDRTPPPPAAKVWKVADAGTLSTPRAWHTATVLPSGKILVIGGSTDGIITGSGNVVGQAELYDPSTRTFSPAGNLVRARCKHSALLLPDGRVVVVGGVVGPAFIKDIEIWDPITRTFSLAGELNLIRVGQQLFLRRDGKVQVVGGYDWNSGPSADSYRTELYDPATHGATLDFFLSTYRVNPTLVPISATDFFLLGGENGDSYWHQLDLIERYTVEEGSSHLLGAGHASKGFTTSDAVLTPAGKVVFGGGFNQINGNLDQVMSLDAQASTAVPYPVETNPLKKVRLNHRTVMLPDGRVGFLAGETFTGLADTTYLHDIEAFDPATKKSELLPVQFVKERARHTATPLPDGSILVIGGYAFSYAHGVSYPSTATCERLSYE